MRKFENQDFGPLENQDFLNDRNTTTTSTSTVVDKNDKEVVPALMEEEGGGWNEINCDQHHLSPEEKFDLCKWVNVQDCTPVVSLGREGGEGREIRCSEGDTGKGRISKKAKKDSSTASATTTTTKIKNKNKNLKNKSCSRTPNLTSTSCMRMLQFSPSKTFARNAAIRVN